MKRMICTTCARTLPLTTFPRIPEGSKCDHERETCRRCWHQWLESQVNTEMFDKISCTQCPNILGQSEVKALATPAVFERYLEAELKATLSADPEFHYCISPGCDSGQIHSEGDIFRCVSCGFKSCVHCHVAWHESETCEGFQERTKVQSEDDLKSAEALKKYAKLCPGCSRKVQKNGGCDHIRCSQCSHEYCWLCFAAQSEIHRIGNTAHQKSCKYHSENLSVSYPFNAH